MIEAKDNKRKWAQRFRVFAIILTIIAATMPAFAQYFKIATPLTYVALVIAGGLVTLDKFFGFSSAWMRFLTTEMAIQQKLSEFLWDWEIRRAQWQGGPPPTFDEVTSMLERCSAFMMELRDILKDEMELWKQEFQMALKDVEAAAKTQRDATQAQLQASQSGGLNLTITNGDQCTGSWSVLVDDRPTANYEGITAALTGLPPGMHRLEVNGEINGKQVADRKAVKISSGTIQSEEFTLA